MSGMAEDIDDVAGASEESIEGASGRIDAALRQITELERRVRELEGRLEAARRLQTDAERRSEAWRGSEKSLGGIAGTIAERLEQPRFPGEQR